jgi:hypothetical protein
MIIMMLSITAKKAEGIHSISLQRQRHTDSSSYHIHILPQGHCPPPCTAVSSKGWSLWILSAMSISSSYTHDLSFTQCIHHCNHNNIKQENNHNSYNIKQKQKHEDKLYISNNGYLWYTTLKIEPGLVSCMFGGGGGCVREGICVALQRWVGENTKTKQEEKKKRIEGWST